MKGLPVKEPLVLVRLGEAARLLDKLKRYGGLRYADRVALERADEELNALWHCWDVNEHGAYSGTVEAYEAQQEIGDDALKLTQRLAQLKNRLEGRA